MTLLQIKTHLWPYPAHYNAGRVSPLSLLAFHLQMITHQGSLIDDKDGQYFYRDSGIPLPRAATFDAWRNLLALGNDSSPFFLIPFLPSTRSDEESGMASSLRGAGEVGSSHLPSLTRRSRLHIRDNGGRISWGSVYIARWDMSQVPLVHALDRSDIAESFVLPRRFQQIESRLTSHGTLRERMEFLAQFGIPGTSSSILPIKSIRRLLFQTLSESHARVFADAFIKARLDFLSDSHAEEQDYLQLIQEIRDRPSSRIPVKNESETLQKPVRAKRVILDMKNIEISL